MAARIDQDVKRSDRFAFANTLYAAQGMISAGFFNSKIALLDFGCGQFFFSKHLKAFCNKIHGFDPYYEFKNCENDASLSCEISFFSAKENLPKKTYDLIVLNSVLQYFNDASEVKSFLESASFCLKEEKGKILIIDVMTPDYNLGLDLFWWLVFAIQKRVLFSLLRDLWMTAVVTQTHKKIFKIELTELEELALNLGFHFKKMSRNCGPSRERYTILLEKI